MEPKKLLRSFVFLLLVGRLVYASSSKLVNTLSNLNCSTAQSSGEYRMRILVKGTSMLKSTKRVRYSVVSTVINDELASWNLRYLYYFNGSTLLGRISEVNRA